MLIGFGICFFFFKQKTAYELRISDWSSDVCSSDLGKGRKPVGFKAIQLLDPDLLAYVGLSYTFRQIPSGGALTNLKIRIGRAVMTELEAAAIREADRTSVV